MRSEKRSVEGDAHGNYREEQETDEQDETEFWWDTASECHVIFLSIRLKTVDG